MLITMLPFAAFPVSAATYGNFTYEIVDGEAILTGCDTTASGGITIPAILGGYPVTAIGEGAFSRCEEITSVKIPNGVTSIGQHAFEYCENVTFFDIPDSVVFIGLGAFRCCFALPAIDLPDHIAVIDRYLFHSCSALELVVLPFGIQSIGDFAFGSCEALKGVFIPDSVASVGRDVFDRCTAEPEVYYFGSAEKRNEIEIDDDNAPFTSATWYYGRLIEDGIIYHLVGEEMVLEKELVPQSGNLVLSHSVIGYPVTAIGEGAFENNRSLTSVMIPYTVTEIGAKAFSHCYLRSVSLSSGLVTIGDGAFNFCTKLTSILIPDGVKTIGENAFSGTGLSSVAVPDSVTSLGNGAFSGCSELNSAILPQGINKISYGLFNQCLELKSLVIPEGVKVIEGSAFSGCVDLDSLVIPDGVEIIEQNAFIGSGITYLTLSAGITEIGAAAFQSCYDLEEVYYLGSPDQKEAITIGDINEKLTSALWYYAELSEEQWVYVVEDQKAVVKDYAVALTSAVTVPSLLGGYPVSALRPALFADCGGIKGISIPDSVEKIGAYTFANCTGLTTLVLPKKLTVIGENAFENCSGLTSVVIPPEVSVIGKSAFLKCHALNKVTIFDSDAWCRIQFDDLFSNPVFFARNLYLDKKPLTDVVIPDGTVAIGNYLFYNCATIAKLAIPKSVTKIGDGAFAGCTALSRIYFGGTAAQQSQIEIGNAAIDTVGWYYEHPADGNWIYCINDGKAEIKTHFGAISGSLQIPSALGGYRVETVGLAALRGQTALTSVVIPDGVVTVKDGAFENCTALESVAISDSVKKIGVFVFNNCSALKSVVLGKELTNIGNNAFAGTSLTDIWYGGTKADKAGITIANYNDSLNNATWHYMFGDLPTSHWAYDGIFYCYRNGIMSGVGDGTNFNPSGTMTRAALVSMLYRLEGSPAVSGNAGFSDVAEGAWYADAVAWASQNGIVSGKGDGRFAPTDPVTRMSFVSILYRYAEYRGDDVTARADLSGFADADSIPAWARANIEWAVAEGLLSGVTSGNSVLVNYGGKATRAQGAVLLQKFCEM